MMNQSDKITICSKTLRKINNLFTKFSKEIKIKMMKIEESFNLKMMH